MNQNQEIPETLAGYHLPLFHEIPTVGLYLNQVAKYINTYMEPFCGMDLTESMISNYVKKHLVSNPVKKQYDREQIAYLIFIAFSKAVLSLDNIRLMIDLQKASYESRIAYDYFVCELENVLFYVFGLKEEMEEIGTDANEIKQLCRDVILTVVRKLYLDQRFARINAESETK